MSRDQQRIDAMNAVASAMMDGALPLFRTIPPAIAFDAVVGVLFFIGEKAGYFPEQVAQLVKSAADQIDEATEDDA